MSNAVASRRPNKLLLRSLNLRLAVLKAEAAGCATEAAYRCVMESVVDTERQIREARG